MYENASILNYFKPCTQPPRLNKRSLPEDGLEKLRAVRRSRSTTPKDSQSEEGRNREAVHLEKDSHRTSSSWVSFENPSTRPPRLQTGEPIEEAKAAQVSKDKISHVQLTPISNSQVPRTFDVCGSQCTSFMSSQRVVKNGEVVIRNSDDDSDSDSSLEDLDDLLLLESRKTQGLGELSSPESQLPSPSLNRSAEDGRRMSGRRRTKTKAAAAPLYSALPVQAKRYKFDLESLARHRKHEEASTDDVVRASAMFRSLEQQKVSTGGNAGTASTTGPLASTFIATVMKEHGDEDELRRLKAAIQRTEASNHGKFWSFFDKQAREPLFDQPQFPISETDRLGRMLGNTFSRQQAFLTGYVGELAMKERLPEEILLWIIDAICLESRDDLRYSYIATLTDASKYMASVFSPERIDMLFRKLGATAVALDIEGPVNPYLALSQSIETVNRPNLLSILDLFQTLASNLNADTRMHVICTLCRLVLDNSVANSCHIIGAIEDTFASLIDSIPQQDLDHELQTVMITTFKSVTDATLRLRLLQNIPASSHQLILLRRRLALACFFQDITYLSQHAENTVDLQNIARHLEGPQFMISTATDYSELTAAVGILSIAIDCGDPPSSPYATEEKAFNRDIDALSLKINSVFADIVDTGASHMGRTEAKEVLEAFQYWLSYGVRTKRPPKKSLFGDSTFHGIANKHMMEAFVEKGTQNTSSVLPHSV